MPNTVAIIDDNTELARAYQKRLKLDGLDVLVFSHATSAIDYMRTLPVDMVVTEYQLPDIAAAELIDIIQTDLGLAQLPVVVFTNQDSYATKQAINGFSNCELVIKKAISATAFSKKIQDLIAK